MTARKLTRQKRALNSMAQFLLISHPVEALLSPAARETVRKFLARASERFAVKQPSPEPDCGGLAALGAKPGKSLATLLAGSFLLIAKDRREVVRLLGLFQDEMETAIGMTLAPGETEPRSSIDKPIVRELRKRWQRCESMIQKLEGDR